MNGGTKFGLVNGFSGGSNLWCYQRNQFAYWETVVKGSAGSMRCVYRLVSEQTKTYIDPYFLSLSGPFPPPQLPSWCKQPRKLYQHVHTGSQNSLNFSFFCREGGIVPSLRTFNHVELLVHDMCHLLAWARKERVRERKFI